MNESCFTISPRMQFLRKITADLLDPGWAAIYCFVSPTEKTVHYVGQSAFPENRVTQHLSNARELIFYDKVVQPGMRKYNVESWIANLMADGFLPEAYVLSFVPSDEAEDQEMKWIDYFFRLGHPILNFRGGWDSRWLISKLRKYNGQIRH